MVFSVLRLDLLFSSCRSKFTKSKKQFVYYESNISECIYIVSAYPFSILSVLNNKFVFDIKTYKREVKLFQFGGPWQFLVDGVEHEKKYG